MRSDGNCCVRACVRACAARLRCACSHVDTLARRRACSKSQAWNAHVSERARVVGNKGETNQRKETEIHTETHTQCAVTYAQQTASTRVLLCACITHMQHDRTQLITVRLRRGRQWWRIPTTSPHRHTAAERPCTMCASVLGAWAHSKKIGRASCRERV